MSALVMGLGSRKHLYLFPSDSISRERVIRKVRLDEGERREALGNWRRVYDTASGDLLGYQLIGPEKKRMDMDLPSMPMAVALSGPNPKKHTAGQMGINVHVSYTLGLNEEQRAEREANHQLPEDQAERVKCKVRVYAKVGSARGDILRVWPREHALPPR
jgi:hypothetical protein